VIIGNGEADAPTLTFPGRDVIVRGHPGRAFPVGTMSGAPYCAVHWLEPTRPGRFGFYWFQTPRSWCDEAGAPRAVALANTLVPLT